MPATPLIEAALKQATAVPLSVAGKGLRDCANREISGAYHQSQHEIDLTTALALAGAAISGALANVEINLSSLKDQSFMEEVRSRTDKIRA